jgi:hypothetical protein
MKALLFILIVLVSLTVATISRLLTYEAISHAPVPKGASKTNGELIIGKWKEIEYSIDGVKYELFKEFTSEYRKDGTVVSFGGWPPRTESRYRLEGDWIINPDVPSIHPSDLPGRIEEITCLIESLTEDELISVTTIQTRYTQQEAELISSINGIPLEQVLAEVRVEIQRSVWVRIKSE